MGFFLLATSTYTLWFVYGSLIYPSFFNVYVYFSGFTSLVTQSVSASIFTNLSFLIYPCFIMTLFILGFYKNLYIKKPFSLFNNLTSLKKIREKVYIFKQIGHSNFLIVYSLGFCFVFILFLLGLGIPSLFGTRILEVLCIGLYPFASESFLRFSQYYPSKKKVILILFIIITIVVVLTGVYRYYTQIQRRILLN